MARGVDFDPNARLQHRDHAPPPHPPTPVCPSRSNGKRWRKLAGVPQRGSPEREDLRDGAVRGKPRARRRAARVYFVSWMSVTSILNFVSSRILRHFVSFRPSQHTFPSPSLRGSKRRKGGSKKRKTSRRRRRKSKNDDDDA